ncbi:transglycosylase domain-containing protein [Neptunicoccus cionae]|uniref:transglycosylase domain-containing protein n=1 Tax=Neptunicoccus cionae TaxID=2035344 RepID=UPI000C769677|nr:PBP1A family penicillin-binding protein [Amylibacter cionae]PLS23010.1 glycosyl transferase [Amylibacter cionae]
MADNGKRGPLVAPKRDYKAAKAKPAKAKSAKASGSKTGMLKGLLPSFRKSKPKAKAPRKKPTGNIFVRAIKWVVGGILRIIWWITFRVAVVLGIIIGTTTMYYYAKLPDATALMDDRQKGSVTLEDDTGQVFAWRGDQFGGLVHAKSVAPQLRNAVIATEDKRFYRHFGLSPRGILGAIRTNMREGRHPLKGHGGSTITQQVAKRVFFSDMNSIERKIKEVPMSLAMEIKYTKDEIMTIYMNRAYLGAGSHGFEAASQRYFSKSAAEVSVPEAAMLAGLLKAPSANAPTRNIGRAQDRADLIIDLMKDQGYLTEQQAAEAHANPAQLSDVAKARAGGYFADWIMESGPEFILKDSTEDLVIRTTFDKRVQKAAEDALTSVFETKVREGSKAQAAIVVLSPDGAVRAIVGGKKSGNAGEFNRATQAIRQTGSSFKPFVYATALQDGWRWDTRVVDERFTINVPGSGPYTPKNYTKDFLGEISLTTALAKSINTVAVKIAVAVGLERVRETARGFGIKNELSNGPAMALGASESTLLEMTGAYAGILNQGAAVEPYGIEELTLQGDSKPLFVKTDETPEQVISQKAARQLIYMMNQVVEGGTGGRARIEGIENAGKTGTTQGARDAWYIGFNSDYVIGVWMGYDDNSKLTGVTGGGLPAEIWRETMVRVLDGKVPAPLPMDVPAKQPVAPKVAKENNQNQQQRRGNDTLRDLAEQIERDVKRLDQEAENVLKKVITGIFGGKN